MKISVAVIFAIVGFSISFSDAQPLFSVNTDQITETLNMQRGRPMLNAEGTTFVGDNGQLLRGPFGSTEWTSAPSYNDVELIKELGFNSIHLYAECFNLDYPNPGSTAPGYAVTEVDKYVQMTRDLGLYLIMTIGNGANNGNYNYDYIVDFWDFYAERYADETHVLFEIQNEPVAWGPPYSDSGATPPGAIDMEVAAYNTIRSHAPDTPILLFSYAVFGGSSGANAALTDISIFNSRIRGNTSDIWNKTAVGFHGYAGWQGTSEAVEALLAAGYPCFMTEFGSGSWGVNGGGFDVHLASELERMKVSWNTFQYVPPWGVSDNVTEPECYKDRVDRAGMSWIPDYGTWPVARGVYNDDNLPWATTSTWIDDYLVGTLHIEAEDFDWGGQDVAYNDEDSNNWGGKYRPNEGVDITDCNDNDQGYAVGWTVNDEWLEYSIYVPEPGFYNLSLRVASSNTDCAARIICYNMDKTGTWTMPNTGSSQTWTTITRQVFLEFGRQKLRIEILTGGFDLNWIELSPSTTVPIENGTYKLANQNSGQVMENNTEIHKVVQNIYSGQNIQKWNFMHLGAGQYRVQSVHDDWYWNTWYNTMTWWWGIESRGQRFIVRPIGDGYYRIVPVDSGLDFEVENASIFPGAAIESNEYSGLPCQKWGILSPSALAFPTCLNASNVSGQIYLTWNGVNGASSYNVKRSIVNGGPYMTIATGLTSTEFTDEDVVEGVSYYYVVCAVSGRQESLNSNEAKPALMHAHLKFDGGRGVTTAPDSTGNGWDGTLIGGARWTSGKIDNAVALDGSDDYISLPDGVVDGLTDFTISTWINLDTISTWSRVFDFGTGTTVNMFLTPRSWTGAVRFAITIGGAGGEEQIDGNDALPSGVWTHVAVTIQGGKGILYVDGVEVGSNNMTLTPNSLGFTTQNYIGKSQYDDPYLNGSVDDFRIYEDALSAVNIVEMAMP